MNKLTDAQNWLLSLWLTTKREYAIPPPHTAQLILLSWTHGHVCLWPSRSPDDRATVFLRRLSHGGKLFRTVRLYSGWWELPKPFLEQSCQGWRASTRPRSSGGSTTSLRTIATYYYTQPIHTPINSWTLNMTLSDCCKDLRPWHYKTLNKLFLTESFRKLWLYCSR